MQVLHVVHGPGDEVIAQRAPGLNHLSTKEEQEEEQCRCGREDRSLKSRVGMYPREKNKAGEQQV